jgi:hypothetical protein
MVKARQQVLGGISKVDGEVVDVVDGTFECIDVVIRGIGVLWLRLLLGTFSSSFHFILLLRHINVGLILFYLHIIMQASILDRE